ncbi:MAG: GDSL-type esterase/lipase family protein [Thermomicrobiales bacterium]
MPTPSPPPPSPSQGGGSPPQRREGSVPFPTSHFPLPTSPRLALLLTLLALPPTSAAAPSAAAPRGIGELYLALGDSLGVGLLTSTPDARGYVAQLHALLQQRAGHAVALQNLSVSGETSGTLIQSGQLTAAQQVITEARGKGWTISPITLDIGGNDLRNLQTADDKAREIGLADFRANLGKILDTLIAASTVNGARTADIAVMTIYNPYGGDPKIVRSDAWWVERFNTALVEEAQRRNVLVADVYKRFLGHERELTWVPLDFHANNLGHLAMAQTLWAAAGYDTTAPTAELLDPTSGTVRRAVPTIKVRASDDIGVTGVQFLLDDKPLPAPVYSRTLDLWVGYWDARTAPSGTHRLTITITDAAGNTTRRDATITR